MGAGMLLRGQIHHWQFHWISTMTTLGGSAVNWGLKVKHCMSGFKGFIEWRWSHQSPDSYPCSHWQASPPAVFLFMFLTQCHIKSINHLFALTHTRIHKYRQLQAWLLTHTHTRTTTHTHGQETEVGDVIRVSRRPVIEPSGLWLQ